MKNNILKLTIKKGKLSVGEELANSAMMSKINAVPTIPLFLNDTCSLNTFTSS